MRVNSDQKYSPNAWAARCVKAHNVRIALGQLITEVVQRRRFVDHNLEELTQGVSRWRELHNREHDLLRATSHGHYPHDSEEENQLDTALVSRTCLLESLVSGPSSSVKAKRSVP
jgi:hypothetical protein